MRPLVFLHLARRAPWSSTSGKPVRGNRRGIDEDDRPAVRLRFVLRELEQVQRAFDVDLVRRHRRELGARRQQRGEVKHQLDLELGEDPLEQRRDRGSSR